MRYQNKATGVVIETKCICKGGNWQDITPASGTNAAGQAGLKPTKGRKGKKEA